MTDAPEPPQQPQLEELISRRQYLLDEIRSISCQLQPADQNTAIRDYDLRKALSQLSDTLGCVLAVQAGIEWHAIRSQKISKEHEHQREKRKSGTGEDPMDGGPNK